MLSGLDGNAFQTAIVSLVSKNHLSFQSIPAIPHGDGGLDGLVGHDVGYCCYGIEEVQAQNVGALTIKTIDKFKGDLLRICEFDRDSKAKPKAKENKALAAVMADGKRLEHIYLVCNVFESNRCIGKLKTFFEKIKKASKCRFVDPDCTVTIEGPKEITGRLTVTPEFHATLDYTLLQKILLAPGAPLAVPPVLSDFEGKMAALKEVFGEKRVQPIEQLFRDSWIAHLALVERLSGSLPQDHLKVSQIINDIRKEAPLHFIGVPVDDAIQKIREYQKLIELRLAKEVPLEEAHARRVASQIVAALVGECGIEWRNL